MKRNERRKKHGIKKKREEYIYIYIYIYMLRKKEKIVKNGSLKTNSNISLAWVHNKAQY
jgi:hypothetical protein